MNEYIIQFSKQSAIDLEDAVRFYNKQQWKLGNKFLSEYEKVLKAITLNPFYASVKYDNTRCAAFKKFPFSVHYTVSESDLSVFIVSIFNTWKEPFW